MPDSAGGGFASGFTGAFQGTLNTAFQAQNLEMQQKRLDLETQSQTLHQYSTLGQIIKSYDQDPAIGEATLTDFMKQMKIDPDQQKVYLNAAKNMTSTTRQGIVDALSEAGMEPNATNVQTLMRAGPANLFTMLGQMRAAKGTQATGEALNQGAPGATPAPAATPSPAAGETPAASPTTPVESAPLPAPGAVPSPPMPAPVATAVGAPPATAMPGLPDNHAAPDATHSMADAPAYASANRYEKMMRAADYLDSNRDATGKAKPSYPDQAQKLRDEADKIAKSANITLPGSDPRVKGMGFKPNTVLQYNAATHLTTVLQGGNDTFTMFDPKDPKYADMYKGQPSGTIIGKNNQTGELAIKVQGKETFQPVTAAMRADYAAKGVMLPVGQEFQQGSMGKLETAGPEQKSFITLTPEQQKAANLPMGSNIGYKKEVNSGEVSPITTGQTTGQKGIELAAERDAKTLQTLAARGEAATDLMKTNQVITSASKQFSTGVTANPRLFAGQVASDLGFPEYAKKFGTAQGEMLESQFGQKVIGAAKLLPGSISDKDTALATKAVGGMFRTVQGNKLMVDLSNWSANAQNDEHLSAEQWQNKFAPGGGGLSTPDPQTGRNWYQTNSEKQRNMQLPDDLRQRLEGVVADMPDKSLKIKEWQTPISAMSLGQVNRMVTLYGDKFNKLQLQLLLKRHDELAGTGGQSGGP